MPSSENTRNPPRDDPVPLWLLVAHEDHPKACTGRRLLHRRIVLPISPERAPRRAPLLLDPHAPQPLGPFDRSTALAGGVLGVDCSWNRLAERGGYPADAAWLRRVRERRRLPLLIATNPQHFGRIGELNTAEAFAATLTLLGEETRARGLMEPFHGGPAFFDVNQDRLAAYRSATSAADLLAAESRLFDPT